MLVVYLDPYFLGDPLFVPGLARDVAARGTGLVLIHGSGERGERALESLGRMPTAADGVWRVDDAEGRAAVERATRDLNREVVHELNEAGVSAIRVMGADRGLLKVADGHVVAGRTGWLGDLVGQGVVAVVASLAAGEGALVEVDPARSAGVLAASLEVPVAALSTASLDGDGALADHQGVVPDAEAIRRAGGERGHVRVGLRAALRQPGGPTAVLSVG
ncbi:hypothetical protein [Rubrivirga sp.]|uniref:hypothetical protein n=1 Tax=Rubrivirga sp. TaxID=1885344 RepID=UPI003B51ACC5